MGVAPHAVRSLAAGTARSWPMRIISQELRRCYSLGQIYRGKELTIVIDNAVVLTVDDRDTVHYGATVAIKDDRISDIGPSAEVWARHPGAERVDGTGKMVMPGFANVHTHLTMT